MASGLPPGSQLAGFRIERQVGAGGMGAVYLATDTTLDRAVALKVVAPELAGDARYRERFLVEARLAASLDHPAIVPVFAAGESDGELYLAMPYMRGGSLADRLAHADPVPVGDALRLLAPIADALDAAHAAGLVHRDVKPGNILLQGDRAFLADFGLARPAAGGTLHDRSGVLLSGTIGYLAPEQIEGDRVDARTDQYSLACVLYECLAGQPPYARDNDLAVVYAHLSEPPPSLSTVRSDLPRAVDAALTRGLEKRPDDRYATCRDLVDAVAAACGIAAAPARRPRRRVAALLGLAAVAAVAAVAGLVVAARGGGAKRATSAAASPLDPVIVVDPASGRVTARLAAGTAPSAIAVGAGAVWVLNRDDRTIARIDPKTHAERTFAVTSGVPYGIAVGAGALWVSTRAYETAGNAAGTTTFPDAVVRLDLTTLSSADPIALPRAGGERTTGVQEIAAGAGAVWAIDPDGTVSRIDPNAQRAAVVPGISDAVSVAVGDGYAWALATTGDTSRLWRIDPISHEATEVPIDAAGEGVFAVGGGAVWVVDAANGYLTRFDPHAPSQLEARAIPQGADFVALTDRDVWVASLGTGSLLRVDPRTLRIISTIALQTTPQAIAAGEGGVWVASLGGLQAAAPHSAPARSGDIPIGTCSSAVGPSGTRPDVLIASDLPLIGPDAKLGQPMADAVRFELARRRYRAGRFTVGYQSCDVGAPDGSVPIAKCLANARAYAATTRLVGIVGSFHSGCTAAELSSTSPSHGGPIATISPTNSAPFLTSDASTFNGGPANFARVDVTDDAWVQAGVVVADSLSVRRLFLLGGRQDDLEALAAATQTGRLTFVGAASFDDNAAGARKAVSEIVAAHADGVYLMAAPDAGTGRMIRLLRKRFGRGIRLIATDKLVPIPTLLHYAGAAADGVYVVTFTPPYAALGDTGRAWLESFAAATSSHRVSAWAPLAAQATDVLLDAIAHSDGTRTSVTRNMLATNERDGILGAFHFAGGDIRPARVPVLRVVGGPAGASPSYQPDFDGAVLDRVLTLAR